MRKRLTEASGPAGLVVSVVALAVALGGVAYAIPAASSKPRAGGILLLNKKRQFPSSAIPKVRNARNADTVGGKDVVELTAACTELAVDMGTWCLQSNVYQPTPEEAGRNDYFFATQKCIELGGYLPTAAQLVGAAARVRLSSTIDDSPLTAVVDEDPSDGTKDRREMSSTLVSTAAGSRAAGSQGVTEGSRGDPRQGEPDPTPQPANPAPETLQYVTVYDNHERGGFAGSKPVAQPESFRCAFDKAQGEGAGELE